MGVYGDPWVIKGLLDVHFCEGLLGVHMGVAHADPCGCR
jgi:hypothetical protein